MDEVAAIGVEAVVCGFALAGVHVYPADDAGEVRAAWVQLPPNVGLVVLSSAAAEALGDDDRQAPGAPLTVVLPP